MNIDALRFRAIASAILPRGTTLTPDEAAAIVQLCFLVTEADLEETFSEREVRIQVSRHVCALANISLDSVQPISPLPLPLDSDGRRAILEDIAHRLGSTEVRELAYVLAYLVAVEDATIVWIEEIVIDELGTIFGIDPARAEELVVHAVEQVTPLSLDEAAAHP